MNPVLIQSYVIALISELSYTETNFVSAISISTDVNNILTDNSANGFVSSVTIFKSYVSTLNTDLTAFLSAFSTISTALGNYNRNGIFANLKVRDPV